MKGCGRTDVGLRRHENQDTFAIETVGESLIAVVCDGMGGVEGGQVASSLAVETFMREIRALLREDMTAQQLRELSSYCVAQANRAVHQRSVDDPACHGMGTTLVSAVVTARAAVVCNIGDSRAYLINADGVQCITRDHSVVEMMVQRGELTPEQAKTHPSKNLITRAVGTEETVFSDVFRVETEPEDCILLCSDGLSNQMADQEILFEVVHGARRDDCCRRLLEIAKNRGAPDNVTSVLIEL